MTSANTRAKRPQTVKQQRTGEIVERDAQIKKQEVELEQLRSKIEEWQRLSWDLDRSNKEQQEEIRRLEKQRVAKGIESAERLERCAGAERDLQNARAQLREQDTKHKSFKDRHKASVDDLRELIKQQTAKTESDQEAYRALADEYQKVATLLENAKAETRSNEEDMEALRKVKEKEVDKLLRDNEDMRTKIRGIQEKAFSTVESAQWAPPWVEDINRSLSSVTAKIKRWSKDYADPDPAAMRDGQVESILRARGCLLGSTKALHAVLSRERPKGLEQMFLQAAVCGTAFLRIFGDPFFAFVGEGGEGVALRQDDAKGMRSLVSLLEERDPAGANAWRCQLLRLLEPVPRGKGDASPSPDDMAELARTTASRALAAQLISDVSATLIPTPLATHPSPLSDLTNIFTECARLSWTLWTQKHQIEVLDLEGMEELQLNGAAHLTFEAESKYYKHHAQHNREIDEDPTALDGREVLLLVNPAIVAAGTTEGGSYGSKRVLMRGTVWMGPAG